MTELATSCQIRWADGTYTFCLKPKLIRELQDKCKSGPQEILTRLQLDTWRIDDIRETIRLGLIGGGLTPTQSSELTERYVDDRPWMENRKAAQTIILAALVGVSDSSIDNLEPDAAALATVSVQ